VTLWVRSVSLVNQTGSGSMHVSGRTSVMETAKQLIPRSRSIASHSSWTSQSEDPLRHSESNRLCQDVEVATESLPASLSEVISSPVHSPAGLPFACFIHSILQWTD